VSDCSSLPVCAVIAPWFKPRSGDLSLVGICCIHRGFVCVLFKLRQATIRKVRDALRNVTGTSARRKRAFDLLTLKVVSQSRVTWATSILILVFLGLSVLDLGPMYATNRRQTDRRQTKASLNAPAY